MFPLIIHKEKKNVLNDKWNRTSWCQLEWPETFNASNDLYTIYNGNTEQKKKATILHDEMSVQDVIFKKRTHPQHMQCFFT